MNFYIVAAGYMGESYTRVYVSAENEERAIELAIEAFEKENKRRITPYPQNYVDGLTFEIIYLLDGSIEGYTE